MPTASVAAAHFNGQGSHLGNMWTFVSVGRVGTGALETIAHNQNRKPLFVIVQADDEENADVLIGACTKDAILVTVANTYTYGILAFFSPGVG